jgi:hypothetical protein
VKTKSPLKIIMATTVVIVALLGVSLFVASKKLNPEEVKKLFISQIESALPFAEVKTTDLDFSLGLTSSVNIHGVDLIYKGKKSKIQLIKVKEVSLKIPFWSLLFGGGKVDFVINEPKLTYVELGNYSNWQYAAGIKKKEPVKNEKGENGIILPTFLAGSELNVSLIDSTLDYKLRDKTEGVIKIEKFLLKDVGVKSTTAFELKSNFDILKGTANETSFDLLVIGESHLFSWIKEKKLNVRTNIKLSNVKNNIFAKEIKKINLDGDIALNNKFDVKINLKGALEDKSSLNFVIAKNKKTTNIENIDIKLNINEITSIFLKDKSALKSLSLAANDHIVISGSVGLGEKISPNLKVATNSPLKFDLEKAKGTADLSVEVGAKEVRVNNEIQTFSGVVVSQVKASLDLNNFSLKKMKPLEVNVLARDMVIPKTFFKTGKTKEEDNTEKESGGLPFLLPMNARFKLQGLDLAGAKVSGEIKTIVKNNGVLLETKGIKIDQGMVEFKNSIQVVNEQLKHNFRASVKDVNLKSFSGFVPPKMIKGISGNFRGNLNGEMDDQGYFVKVVSRLENGKLEKVNMKDLVSGFVDKLGPLKKKIGDKGLDVDGEFRYFSFTGDFDNNVHNFSDVRFLSKNESLEVKALGMIKMTGKSLLKTTFDIKSGAIAKTLKKELGTTSLPVELVGTGYLLKPDYGKTTEFVTKKLAKSQVKKQGKKQIQKLLKKKNLNKLLKNKDVNKLLNNVFK